MGSGKWVGHDPSGAGWPGVWLVAGYPPRTASLGVLSVLPREAESRSCMEVHRIHEYLDSCGHYLDLT